MRVLYLIPALGHSGATRQLELLARGMTHDGLDVEVCQLGPENPASARLRAAGVSIHSLGWRRSFDPAALLNLRGLLQHFQPDLIHAWHRSTLHVLGLVGRSFFRRVVLSQPFSWEQGPRIPRLDRWLLKRIARIVVQGDAEAQLGEREGLFLEKLAVIPPGIAVDQSLPATKPSKERRNIVCIGPLAGHKGYRDALWAFDIIRHVVDNVRLVYLGEGPERAPLERFGTGIECRDLIDFIGDFDNIDRLLAEAEVCWIPSRRGGGTHATLESMLAGRPIVACGVPNLHGLIVDGQSGFVVPPGDKVNLARRTHQILLDPALAQRLGDAARLRALRQFGAPHFLERCRRMYDEIAA